MFGNKNAVIMHNWHLAKQRVLSLCTFCMLWNGVNICWQWKCRPLDLYKYVVLVLKCIINHFRVTIYIVLDFCKLKTFTTSWLVYLMQSDKSFVNITLDAAAFANILFIPIFLSHHLCASTLVCDNNQLLLLHIIKELTWINYLTIYHVK